MSDYAKVQMPVWKKVEGDDVKYQDEKISGEAAWFSLKIECKRLASKDKENCVLCGKPVEKELDVFSNEIDNSERKISFKESCCGAIVHRKCREKLPKSYTELMRCPKCYV